MTHISDCNYPLLLYKTMLQKPEEGFVYRERYNVLMD